MRHGVMSKRFDRPTGPRVAMFRNMVTSLLNSEKIVTTEAKAKTVRSMAEKLITKGKAGDVASRREAMEIILDTKVTEKLFSSLATRYATRNGGYTRMIKLGARLGDGATIVQLELIK